jgi:deoxycytidine triphosphate deaminase
MTIQSDRWIREQALKGMIEPFNDGLAREGVISYGLSSFGYDLRAAPDWRIFVNAFNTVVDPKHFNTDSLVEAHGETCVIPPNSFVLTRSVEYLRIPEDVMVVALGKSSYARCFRGDTRVALADGSAPTLEEMAQRHRDGEDFFGYSIGAFGELLVTLLDAPRHVGRDDIVEITLDNGQRIHCTPDHRFLSRNGRMIVAAELAKGTSLMPLYRTLARGYEMVYLPLTGHLYPTHRLADAWNLRNGIYEDLPGTHRHHLDHDRQNNMPWNLARMDASEHIRYHNARNYGGDFDPDEHSAAIRDAFERLRRNPDWEDNWRRAQRDRAVAFWNDPIYSQRRSQLIAKFKERWTANERQAQRERQQLFWENNYEARRLQGLRSKVAWSRDEGSRRERQREIARSIRLRGEIGATEVRGALHAAGSIRGAARMLGCDRSVFRRYPEELRAFRGLPPLERRNHKVVSIRSLKSEEEVFCLTVPEAGNFALEAGVFVENCGIVANVTPLEPGWEGHVTLELSNTTPLPAKVYANEGIVQLLFFKGERPETTYADRKGKYQGQRGVTLPKL